MAWTTPTDPTGTWVASSDTVLTWAATSSTTPVGNTSRFVQSRPFVEAGQRGVDFPEAITVESPWALTTSNAVPLNTTARNDP